MKLRKSSKIKERRITLKRKVTSILIKRIIIVLVMAIVSGICTGTVLAIPLISAGSTWRYFDGGTDPGIEWRQLNFDDSGWSSGPAQLGYGDDDENTVVNCGPDAPRCMSDNFITTYFRHTFQVSNHDAYPALLLKVLHDDGCVVYLNGEEVARSNMPGTPCSRDIHLGTLAASGVGGPDENTFYEFSVDGSLLEIGNNVVAVEIHQWDPGSSDISFDLELDVYGAAPLLEKGPYLLYPGVNTEMTVLWQLDDEAACCIEWRHDTTNDDGFAETTEYGDDHQHKYTISDLTPGEKYFYRVVNGDSEYRGSFHAAPPDNARNVKFFAYGDTRSYPSDHDSVANEMINTYTADPAYQTIALHMGDWVNRDTEVDWQDQFFPHSQPNIQEFMANVPINGCIGNHENDYGQHGEVFNKYWPYLYIDNFYWSFDYGPVHVVVLDQYVDYLRGSTQYDWLVEDLDTTTKPWKFIILHEPGWSAGPNPNNEDVQELIQNLRDDDQVVDIVFAGHNHNYVRADVNGIPHITTGGGGAPLYDPDPNYPNVDIAVKAYHFCEINIQGDTLYMTARDNTGNVIDAFPCIPLPSDPAYGKIRGGDQSHIDEVNYCFGGLSGDVTLNFEAWDVDFTDEVEIILNGTHIDYAAVTNNDSWGGVETLTLPDALVNDSSDNYLTFNNTSNPPNTWWWGVRNVSASVEIPCIPLPSDPAYGKIRGGDQSHIDEVNYCFGGLSGDVTLNFEAWDVDFTDEVEIILNGTHIDYAAVTNNDSWGGVETLTLPDALVNDSSDNYLTFNNTSNPPNTWWWGVRNVSASVEIPCIPLPSDPAYGKIRGGDQSHIDEVNYCFGGLSGDVTLNFEAWDVDFTDEVEIILNGTHIDYAAVTNNDSWGGVETLTLPDALVNDSSDNYLTFNNTSNPPNTWWWGVRNVSASVEIPCIPLPSDPAYGKIRGGDQSHIDEVNYCFGGLSGDVTLNFEAWDVDFTDEVEIILNGTHIDYAAVTNNDSWGGVETLTLPDALVNDSSDNYLTFNNTSNPPNTWWWGVRNVSASVEIPCIPLPSDPAYGKIRGGDQSHIDEVNYCFGGLSGDVTLNFEAWDVDFTDEVEIILNGTHIDYAAVTNNDSWGGVETLTLPDALVNDSSDNYLTFNNTSNPPNTWWWGVRNVYVDVP